MTSLIQARVDSKLKEEAENIMSQLGISLNEAIRMFLKQVIIQQGIPFKPTLRVEPVYEPNEKLKKIIQDVEDKKGLTVYKNTDEMSQEEYRKAAIEAVKQLKKDVNIPETLKDINVKEEDLEALAEAAMADVCTGGNPRPCCKELVLEVYKKAFYGK